MELTENFSSLWNLNKENGKDYPRIEEVWIDKEVNDIVCEICCIRANFGNYDRIKQWRRNGVKFVTVSFSKMGNFYKQASVHEFGITSAVDSVECRRKVSQGKVSIPITAHTKCYLSKHTEKKQQQKTSCRSWYVQSAPWNLCKKWNSNDATFFNVASYNQKVRQSFCMIETESVVQHIHIGMWFIEIIT